MKMVGEKCKHCSMMIPPDAKICPYCRKKQGMSKTAKILLIFIGVSLLIIYNSMPPSYDTYRERAKQAVNQSTTQAEQNFNKLSPSEHLQKAKESLKGYVPNKSWGNVAEAKKHLLAIPKNTQEWRDEGKKLWDEVRRREKEIEKESKIIAEKMMSRQRKTFAENYERSLLDKGMDVHVYVHGKDNTILKLKWVLISRPLVYKMINDEAFVAKLRDLGFKKLIMTDGYNGDWNIDLKN